MLRCWLRESSAHIDFMSSNIKNEFQVFLSDILNPQNINTNNELSAAGRKIQVSKNLFFFFLFEIVCIVSVRHIQQKCKREGES